MKAGYGKLKAGSSAVSAALGAARSARNRATRDAAADARDAGASARRYKRARAREDRERERAMNRRFRVQVADTDRPRMNGRTPHRLFYRLGGQAMGTRITAASSGGTRSIHFAVTARGFASRTGRAWRGGEGERAALYIVREDALEGGEAGWWSNIAADRNELVAFHRASEAFERHDRANANVYMSEVIALPDSLTAKQRRKAVRRYCRTFDRRGLGYTVAMHLPDPNGDGRNYHCHIIYSLRPVTRLGAYDWSLAASKVADVNTPDGIRARRSLAVAAINATLKASGSTQRYTEASNRARGLGRPSPKQGQKQTWTRRRAAAAEAHLTALAPLQAATATLRAGLALLTRMEAARLDMVSRLRGVQKASADALADQDRHLVAVHIRVRDGLTRERSPGAEAQPDARVMTAKSTVVDRLAGAMAGFDRPDAFETRIIAAAAAHARRQARRRADAEALHAAARLVTAASSFDLEPWRTDVVARLSERRTALNRPLPELTQTRAAVQVRLGVVASRIGASYTANRQRITDLAPGRGSEDTGRVDPPTATQGLAEPAAHTPNTTVTPPALTGTAGDDLALFAANRDDEARQKRIAAAREAARIAEIRDRAFARLAAPGVRIRLADTGNYRIPSGILDADERAALNHADYRGETRARLASLHAVKNSVEAREDPPETATATATSPGATVTAPTLAVTPVPIPSASQDEDLALLQAAKDLEDVKRGR